MFYKFIDIEDRIVIVSIENIVYIVGKPKASIFNVVLKNGKRIEISKEQVTAYCKYFECRRLTNEK